MKSDKKKKKVEKAPEVKVKNKKEKKEKETKPKKDNFFKLVIAELKKTVWPDKNYMVKYSIATFVVIISCSVYFYLFYLLFTFIKELR